MYKNECGDDESEVSKVKMRHGAISQVRPRHLCVGNRKDIQRLMQDIGNSPTNR